MGGDPTKRNQNLYYTYHQDKGHTTERCKVFKDHLEQLVKFEHSKEFFVDPWNGTTRHASRSQGKVIPPPLGVIEVIHTASKDTSVTRRRGVLTVVLVKSNQEDAWPEKKVKLTREPIAFYDEQPNHMMM